MRFVVDRNVVIRLITVLTINVTLVKGIAIFTSLIFTYKISCDILGFRCHVAEDFFFWHFTLRKLDLVHCVKAGEGRRLQENG